MFYLLYLLGDMSDDERKAIANMRAMALECLEPKPRPISQRAAQQQQQQIQNFQVCAQKEKERQARVSKAEAAKAQTKKELIDPETIDMETLISVRRAWDQFLVAPHSVPGASSIPPVRAAAVINVLLVLVMRIHHSCYSFLQRFVPPPATPSPQWAAFLSTS